jgi:hypothetical protein
MLHRSENILLKSFELKSTRSEELSRREKFLIVLAYGKVSILEIESVINSQNFAASIFEFDDSCALLETDVSTASALIRRLGSCYKIARVLGSTIENGLSGLDLPFEPKFNWTLSAYECSDELYNDAMVYLRDLLKIKGLGKSKFVPPQIILRDGNRQKRIRVAEVRAEDVNRRILAEDSGNCGFDFVIHGGIKSGKPIYAQTIGTFDSNGFDVRDLERPYQDPKRTLSPRIARTLVNLAAKEDSRILLDPFCGLGTILEEALMCDLSVVGVDADQKSVEQTKRNLKWLRSKFRLSSDLRSNVFAYDARRISHARMPRVNAIASEPIILPTFKSNPSVLESKMLLEKVRRIYEKCLLEFRKILGQSNDRVVITTPIIVDASGKRRTLNLTEAATDAGFKSLSGETNLTKDIVFPIALESSKKKIIHRELNAFCLV